MYHTPFCNFENVQRHMFTLQFFFDNATKNKGILAFDINECNS